MRTMCQCQRSRCLYTRTLSKNFEVSSQIKKKQSGEKMHLGVFTMENTTFYPGTRLVSIKLVLENFYAPLFILYLQNFQTGLTMQPACYS